MIGEIKEAGFDTVELGFNLTEKVLDGIVKLADRKAISISSVHNFCPMPSGMPAEQASPDHFSLASHDQSERKKAVDCTKRTMEVAKHLKAKVVVLHAGRIEIKDKTRKLYELICRGENPAKFVKEMLEERNAKQPGHFKNVMSSLEDLAGHAKKVNIKIAVENRYYFREIPSFDELSMIFSHFGKNEIFYWHDMGHAQLFEHLGLQKHRDYLSAFSKYMTGIHIHDIIGIKDHKPPFSGEMDFSLIKPFISDDDIIKVLEIHQPATSSDIKESVERLKSFACQR